jgi:hypothetical protein
MRRGAPIVAAVLSLAGVGVAAALQPEPLPPCPTRNGYPIVRRTDSGKLLCTIVKPKVSRP